MLKAWLNLWKNIFNYKDKATRKEYWLSLLTNLIAMYVFIIPYAFLCKYIAIPLTFTIIFYMVIMHLPVLAIYFRRANDVGWHIVTTIYLAIVAPIISGLLVGALPPNTVASKHDSFMLKLLALCLGLFLYGGFFGILLYDDPGAFAAIPISGLLLSAAIFIYYAIKNYRLILAFFGIHLK